MNISALALIFGATLGFMFVVFTMALATLQQSRAEMVMTALAFAGTLTFIVYGMYAMWDDDKRFNPFVIGVYSAILTCVFAMLAIAVVRKVKLR